MRREANRTPLLFIDRDGAKRGPGLGKSNLPSLPPAARYTLQEQAYLRLREALMSGHFVPGQAITLRAAAEALGTSPMPVRWRAKRFSETSSNRRKDWRACCARRGLGMCAAGGEPEWRGRLRRSAKQRQGRP